MSPSSKATTWREYTIQRNKELYSEFMDGDFWALEKEIVSIVDEMVETSKKFLHEYDDYTSQKTDWKTCALWFIESYEKYTSVFSRNYTLDVHILGNPTEGPVAKASRNLEKIITNIVKDKIQAGYIIKDMLNDSEKRNFLVNEYIDDKNADELYDNLKILVRSQELEDLNNKMAHEYFYKCLGILFSGINAYAKAFFGNELEEDIYVYDKTAKRLKRFLTVDL